MLYNFQGHKIIKYVKEKIPGICPHNQKAQL